MQLQLNSCTDSPDLSISNSRSFDQREGGRFSQQIPVESISGCGTGAHSRVSTRNSDPIMITSASPESSATGAACTIGSWSNASAGLNESLHLAVNRHNDTPLVSSRQQPRMVFSSSSGATADHERTSWSPARCYACNFCGREFNSAQALGGHMNIHRRDRARLRTSTSPGASIPHDQADLPPILHNTVQYSGASIPFETQVMNEAASRENQNTAFFSSPNFTYKSTNITSATPTFSLLDMSPPASDPTLGLLALAAYPSQQENLAPPFSVPLVDLAALNNGSVCSSSSAARIPKLQSVAHSLSSSIAPHASLLFARPRVESSSIKHGEAELQMITGQGSAASPLARPDSEAANTAQLIQTSQSTGRAKRARVDAGGIEEAAAKSSTAGRSCRLDLSLMEKSNSRQAACPFDGRPSTPDGKSHLCLDLELRLGQSSQWDSDAKAGESCRSWTTATTTAPAPARPTRS